MQGIVCSTIGQVNRQFSGEQITVANQTKVFSEDCKDHYILLQNSYDTLETGYYSCIEANTQFEKSVNLLEQSIEISKVLTQSCEAEKMEVEKQLKKKVRQNKFKEGLLWAVSGISAALIVLYLVK